MEKVLKVEKIQKYYGNKDNITKAKGNIFIFIISVILIILALIINDNEFRNINSMSGTRMIIAIIMLIIGIYLFYISFSSFIVKRYLKNKSRKYKKDNMFLYRNLTSKINTISITMGTIAVMFTIILVGGNVAVLLNDTLNNEIEMGYPFEIMINTVDGDFSKYKQYIENNSDVTEMYEYKTYNIHKTGIYQALNGTIFESRYYEDRETIITLTDYNKLGEMLGYDQINLNENEVIIQVLKTAESYFEDYVKENNKLNIAGKEMTIKEVRSENFGQMSFNGYTYFIVVPDSLIQLIEKENVFWNSNIDSCFSNYTYNIKCWNCVYNSNYCRRNY